jgi:soluble lytic murein transglycosylase
MKKLLAFLLHLLLLTHPDFIHSEPQEPFPNAYELFSQGNFSKAQDLFLESLDHASVLEDYNLYFLGMISFHQGSLDSARNYFSQLKKKFSKSLWVNQADLHLAKIALKEGHREQALERLRTLRSRGVRNPTANEALFLIGQTYRERGEPDRAASFFQKLRYADPLSLWARSAKKEVQSIREQHPQLLGLKEPGDMLEEGRLLLLERDYDKAERVFQRSFREFSAKNLRLRSLLGLAKVYRKSRKRQKESGVLAEIVKQYPGSSQAPKSLYRFAEIFWNQSKDLKALAEFKRLKERYPQSRFIDLADIASARIYESLQRHDEAMHSYQDFPKKHPRSALREQAAWRLAWMHYLQANYSQAHDAFEHIAAGIGSRNYRTGGLFWQARTAERLGRLERAKQIYWQILNAQQDSYYMEPTTNALKRMGETVKTRKPTKGLFSSDGSSPRNPNISFHLSRAKKLAEFSLHHLAVVELDQIKNQMDGDPALRMTLIKEYVRNQGFDRSVKLANQIYAPTGELKRYSYPLAYWDIVQKKAVKRGLDPYLVLALVRQESLFDPQALSPASAFGLMQLLASTAGREAKRMGLPPPETEKLYDPDLNIMLGTQHLKGLLQIYSNNLVKAIAAYNAGKTAVDRWERELSALDQEEFIERITYRETRLYVKLVLRNYWIYKNLYDNSDEKTVQK